MKFSPCLMICLLMAGISCTKSNTPSVKKPIVYVGGLTGTLGLQTQGVMWVNDSITNFTGASQMTSISVDGSDIYALDGNVYFKNGTAVTVPDVLFSSKIMASGNDVYVIGATLASSVLGGSTAAAVYWKNSVLVNLTQNLPDVVAASTKDIFVSGNDVYVCGYLATSNNDTLDAVYWKNGELNHLPNGYMATCISVSGSDVYVGGSSLRDGDVYWKNGTMHILGNAAWVNSIATSGSDVYIAGFTALGPDQACYWKNGQLMPLPEGFTATGITVSGTDVYCSGNTNANYACYWKNGIVDTLGPGMTSSIAVRP
jgi:hypothetical protein